jgi:hypothetical protein
MTKPADLVQSTLAMLLLKILALPAHECLLRQPTVDASVAFVGLSLPACFPSTPSSGSSLSLMCVLRVLQLFTYKLLAPRSVED